MVQIQASVLATRDRANKKRSDVGYTLQEASWEVGSDPAEWKQRGGDVHTRRRWDRRTEDGAAGGRREGSGGLTGSLLLHPARLLCSVLQLKQHQFKYVSLVKMKPFIQIRSRWRHCLQTLNSVVWRAVVNWGRGLCCHSCWQQQFTPITNGHHFMLISVTRNSHCVLASS